MNLPEMVLDIAAAIVMLLLGVYLGYRLTRHTAFNKILEPAIRKAFSRGYTKGFEDGWGYLLEEIRKLAVLDTPLSGEAVLQFMRDVAEAHRATESAPLASVNWNEEPQE